MSEQSSNLTPEGMSEPCSGLRDLAKARPIHNDFLYILPLDSIGVIRFIILELTV